MSGGFRIVSDTLVFCTQILHTVLAYYCRYCLQTPAFFVGQMTLVSCATAQSPLTGFCSKNRSKYRATPATLLVLH